MMYHPFITTAMKSSVRYSNEPYTRTAYNTPKTWDGSPVSCVALRVDGLSFITSDTALFHMIYALPHHAMSYNVDQHRVTIVDAKGAVYIAQLTHEIIASLKKAGFREISIASYFAHNETLVEPNPRGVTMHDITNLEV